MRDKFTEATLQRPDGNRLLDAPVIIIDLPELMEQIKHEQSWKDSDRNALTVFKTKDITVVLIALHKGAAMVYHAADEIINIQVLDGGIRLSGGSNDTVELGKGQMLALHQSFPHSLKALEETIFLLTLFRNDE